MVEHVHRCMTEDTFKELISTEGVVANRRDVPVSLCLCLSVSVCVSVCVSVSLCLSVSLSLCLSVSLCLLVSYCLRLQTGHFYYCKFWSTQICDSDYITVSSHQILLISRRCACSIAGSLNVHTSGHPSSLF